MRAPGPDLRWCRPAANCPLVGHRILHAVPALIGIIIVTFILTRALPGDPAIYFAGPTADAETIAQVAIPSASIAACPCSSLRLPARPAARRPRPGDLDRPEREPRTDRPAAGLARTDADRARRRDRDRGAARHPCGDAPDSWIDHLCRFVVTLGVSLPTFFTGLALVYVFYYRLGWAPAPMGRLDILYAAPTSITGFYTVDALLTGDFETFRAPWRNCCCRPARWPCSRWRRSPA